MLEVIFGKTHDEALKLMLAIDCDGSGECGAYTPELASKIADQVAELARQTERLSSPLHRRTKPKRLMLPGRHALAMVCTPRT